MANKEKSIAELEQEFENAREALATARKIEAQKAAEEAERQKAALAAEKEKRYAEVEEARKHYENLFNAYLKDYGSYSTTGESVWHGIFRSFL